MCLASKIYPQSENILQFRLSRIKEIKILYIAEVNEGEKWAKYLINILLYSTKLTIPFVFCQTVIGVN